MMGALTLLYEDSSCGTCRETALNTRALLSLFSGKSCCVWNSGLQGPWGACTEEHHTSAIVSVSQALVLCSQETEWFGSSSAVNTGAKALLFLVTSLVRKIEPIAYLPPSHSLGHSWCLELSIYHFPV